MSKIKILLSVFSLFLISWLVWYWLVFAWPLVVKDEITSLTSNIFRDNSYLFWNKIILTSGENPRYFSVSWDCSITWNYLKSEGNFHIFEVKIWDFECEKDEVEVIFKNTYKTLKYSFKLIKNYDLFYKYLDYSSEDLEKMLVWLKQEAQKIKLKNSLTEKDFRVYAEILFFEDFFTKILEKRLEKYTTPVVWAKLPTRATKVPNSPRPYRASYTDWIHQWWDFDAPKMTNSVAIDDGIVIRVVNWFTWSDFSKIQRENITDDIKHTNLDILRWNQVWLKTMKWDVAIYSHFEEILPEIKVWSFLKKWEIIWKIWATWVPEEGYSDFHMHLELNQNPLNSSKAWTYSFLDIMYWPWYFKGKSSNYVLEHQYEIFEEN